MFKISNKDLDPGSNLVTTRDFKQSSIRNNIKMYATNINATTEEVDLLASMPAHHSVLKRTDDQDDYVPMVAWVPKYLQHHLPRQGSL